MAKTRLTKAMREETLENVLKATDFEAKKKDILERAGKVARTELIKPVPKEFFEMIKGYPAEWFLHTGNYGLFREHAPENAFRPHESWYGCTLHFEPFPHPCGLCLNISKERQQKLFGPFRKEAERLMENQTQLKTDLKAFLLSCTTVEAVLEKMPELKPHIPEKVEFFAPAVNTGNLLTQLMKSGFVVEEAAALNHARQSNNLL